MGISLFKISTGGEDEVEGLLNRLKNAIKPKKSRVKEVVIPDIRNFKIEAFYIKKNMAVLRVNYPSCNNYEGHKIIVAEGIKYRSDLLLFKDGLDPHFVEKPKNEIRVIARFEPTKRGWDWAVKFVNERGR